MFSSFSFADADDAFWHSFSCSRMARFKSLLDILIDFTSCPTKCSTPFMSMLTFSSCCPVVAAETWSMKSSQRDKALRSVDSIGNNLMFERASANVLS